MSGNARDGIVVNAPTRAVKGHDWDGVETDWTKASYGYGAIHFHDDDLNDACWKTDLTVTIPRDALSGAYVVAATGIDANVHDDIAFFESAKPRPKAAFVLSTFTYVAYANEHMWDMSRESKMTMAGGDVVIRKDAYWRRMARHPDLGLAVYDVHNDGSGNVHTTARAGPFSTSAQATADQFMINFLEEQLGRGGYDVVTEHDVHVQGVSMLESYDAVITGCHPEYPSRALIDAYVAYTRGGGNIMYLGGNGFYWCSTTDPARPHRMEVCKGDQGCRSIEVPAGERMHALDGQLGGLWRSRGRYAQTLFGVGPDSCGTGPGVPYKVWVPDEQAAECAWVWKGLEAYQTADSTFSLPLIVEFGFGGGASGDEMDRLDYKLGSPSNAVLLATSTGHDESFGIFNEEMMFPMVDTLGPQCDRVRSDMTYYETAAGGAVFSVGSIEWFCSLAWDNYKNTVAVITWNVLEEFLQRGKGDGMLSVTGNVGWYTD
ncbi:hypothetical protein SCUCBS95973_001626 [Sporothrix curviconia]|uniref:N,N-dimethylformamidase beta subunit-like C-terminal domain-containing protein n=1 Tax=Sporothrix curviconia TaxID=1260050 RepID=A0ABP0B045_9PEZI